MGTLTEEPRKVYRGVRFTVKEDFEIRKMMKQEDYLSVSKYIRDKALSKSSRKEMAYEQLAKLIETIQDIGMSYNNVVELLNSEKGSKSLIKTLVSLTRDLKKSTEKAVILADSIESGKQRVNNNFMIQKIEIIGNVVADAELKQSKSGNQYVSFTVVVNEGSGDEKRSTYYDVGTSKTGVLNFIKKGRPIYVSGRLSLSAVCRDNKAYLNAYITASEIDFTLKES